MREWRRKNKESHRAYIREYNRKWRKEHGYRNEENSKRRYPEKEAARRMLQRAVMEGKIKKVPCEVCGNKQSEAHHPDHSQALVVIWLCRKCHQLIHGRSMDLAE